MRDEDFELVLICIVVAILVFAINAHCSETRNLQLRVGQLEQQVNR